MKNIKNIIRVFEKFRLLGLNSKYLNNDHLAFDKSSCVYKIKEIGLSENGESINTVQIGSGKIKILIWSQMHGNESTSTKSLLDLINSFHNNEFYEILKNCSLYIIPILNPDGARLYTRENFNKIDLNRDAKENSQLESKLLNSYFEKIKPNYCFNLHDQRTIYGGKNGNNPSGLSFLAPCYDYENSINSSRANAMFLIEGIYSELSNIINDKVRLYDDNYNYNCFGDHFQKKGSSTVLFESGFFDLDYNRETTRKYMFVSLVIALNIICNKKNYTSKVNYSLIPKNKIRFFDIILNNVSAKNSGIQVGVNFKETLCDNEIIFKPIISDIGDLTNFLGHREIDLSTINYNRDLISFKIGAELNESLANSLNL
ncbi:MAG: M14 family zinc carboxypeptidase [Flavobacteriaceae bacterium]|nr:M14 family zinc carboxypeptidase [Flavobacteriaceae bacterium]